MIELAPNHKYGLSLKSPVMTASGAAGYGDEYSDLIDYNRLGAFVTNPVSLRPRKATLGTRLRIHSGHLVVHTGLPNPGVKTVIRKYRRVWERLPIPVIVHLIATTPAETSKAAAYLSNAPGVLGIELGLADHIEFDRAQRLVHAATEGGDLPVMVRIPFGRVDEFAPLLMNEGASTLVMTAPPRVVLPPEDRIHTEDVPFYRGRLYGPVVFPFLLDILSRWSREISLPIVASGGIQSAQQALECLKLGALAVQIDAVMWRDPTLIQTLAHELSQLLHKYVNNEVVKEEKFDDENMESNRNAFDNPFVGT
jgi:dihydroorotate dehydrogenase (NAD+) catalytic subunit